MRTRQQAKLRLLIRQEVRTAITEIRSQGDLGVPRTWGDFRQKVAAALHRASAPIAMVDLVADTDNVGHLVAPLWSAWESISYELDDAESEGEDLTHTWNMILDAYVEDLVRELLGSLRNPMNFGPGAAPELDNVDVAGLSDDLMDALTV